MCAARNGPAILPNERLKALRDIRSTLLVRAA